MRPAEVASADVGGARIGPNAAIQLADALRDLEGAAVARDVFARVGLERWIDQPPSEMIAEGDAARLHHAVLAQLDTRHAHDALAEAGRRTGAYILAHRIPKPAQALLKALPSFLALPILLGAIKAHAWTFAGSGVFEVHGRRVRIQANPLAERGAATPQCIWHVQVFETLIRTLAAPNAQVTEVACCAKGDPACEFEIKA